MRPLRRGARTAERTGTPADLLVVGLGNPGAEFAGTKHNVGADVVELLAQRHGARLRKSKERALVGEVRVGDIKLPPDVVVVNDPGDLIATISVPRGLEPGEGEPEAEEGAEGEAVEGAEGDAGEGAEAAAEDNSASE